MKLNDISKPLSAAQLNENLSKKFGQRIKIETFTREQLENVRNKLRTTLSQIETNESFDSVNNEGYQKNKMFLDVVNAAIKEMDESDDNTDTPDDNTDESLKFHKKRKFKKSHSNRWKHFGDEEENNAPAIEAREEKVAKKSNFDERSLRRLQRARTLDQAQEIALSIINDPENTIKPEKKKYFARQIERANSPLKIVDMFYQMMLSGEGLGTIGTRDGMGKSTYRNKFESKNLREGEEDKAEIIMAAKDMVDRLTGWMEDTAEMQTESMLELADAIRDELGSQQSEGFSSQVKPALETLYQAMEQTRVTLTQGVGLLTGETDDMGMMGADDEMGGDDMEPTVDGEDPLAIDGEDPSAGDEDPRAGDDEFGASGAADGGSELAGRPKRESRDRRMEMKRKMLESSRRLGMLLGSKKNR